MLFKSLVALIEGNPHYTVSELVRQNQGKS